MQLNYSKGKLIPWVLFLQEFDLKFKDKKSTENVVADHLYHLNFDPISKALPLNESFPNEQLMNEEVLPWFADILKYFVTSQLQYCISTTKSIFFCENK